jgi:hypothetical protein
MTTHYMGADVHCSVALAQRHKDFLPGVLPDNSPIPAQPSKNSAPHQQQVMCERRRGITPGVVYLS